MLQELKLNNLMVHALNAEKMPSERHKLPNHLMKNEKVSELTITLMEKVGIISAFNARKSNA